MGEHFDWFFDEEAEEFSSRRREDSIRAEERLDGTCEIRTSPEPERLADEAKVREHNWLARVGRAFR